MALAPGRKVLIQTVAELVEADAQMKWRVKGRGVVALVAKETEELGIVRPRIFLVQPDPEKGWKLLLNERVSKAMLYQPSNSKPYFHRFYIGEVPMGLIFAFPIEAQNFLNILTVCLRFAQQQQPSPGLGGESSSNKGPNASKSPLSNKNVKAALRVMRRTAPTTARTPPPPPPGWAQLFDPNSKGVENLTPHGSRDPSPSHRDNLDDDIESPLKKRASVHSLPGDAARRSSDSTSLPHQDSSGLIPNPNHPHNGGHFPRQRSTSCNDVIPGASRPLRGDSSSREPTTPVVPEENDVFAEPPRISPVPPKLPPPRTTTSENLVKAVTTSPEGKDGDDQRGRSSTFSGFNRARPPPPPVPRQEGGQPPPLPPPRVGSETQLLAANPSTVVGAPPLLPPPPPPLISPSPSNNDHASSNSSSSPTEKASSHFRAPFDRQTTLTAPTSRHSRQRSDATITPSTPPPVDEIDDHLELIMDNVANDKDVPRLDGFSLDPASSQISVSVEDTDDGSDDLDGSHSSSNDSLHNLDRTLPHTLEPGSPASSEYGLLHPATPSHNFFGSTQSLNTLDPAVDRSDFSSIAPHLHAIPPPPPAPLSIGSLGDLSLPSIPVVPIPTPSDLSRSSSHRDVPPLRRCETSDVLDQIRQFKHAKLRHVNPGEGPRKSPSDDGPDRRSSVSSIDSSKSGGGGGGWLSVLERAIVTMRPNFAYDSDSDGNNEDDDEFED